MANSQRFSDRHPLCTCPRRSTFPGVIERQADCPGGATAHPPPLGLGDLAAMLAGEVELASVDLQHRMTDVQPPESAYLDLSIFRRP